MIQSYSIICSHGRKRDAKGKWAESTVKTGLPYAEAKAECDRLQAVKQTSSSSWTHDIFFLQCEKEWEYAIFCNEVMVKPAQPVKQAQIECQRLNEKARKAGSKEVFYLRLRQEAIEELQRHSVL